MKKLIALSLILLALGAMAFADDALTMPAMVGRVYIAPNFTFIPGQWDENGNYEELSETRKVFNLAFALEFGVTNWITAAVQWVPGWTPWSDLGKPFATGTANTNGVGDLFAGAKFQILGEKAPIQNDNYRFAAALGVIIPLPGPDFAKEFSKASGGKDFTAIPMDNHVFAIGGRFYFDWIVTENFFLNLYNETRIYPIKQDVKNTGALEYHPVLGLIAQGFTKVNYKYELTFEVEGVYETYIADGVKLTAGLPFTFTYNPKPEYTGPGVKWSDDDSYVMSTKPSLTMFLTNTPLPLEFKIYYGIPVFGSNAQAKHTICFQARIYFALPGADI